VNIHGLRADLVGDLSNTIHATRIRDADFVAFRA